MSFSDEMIDAIRKAWDIHRNATHVARELGIGHRTARRYRPDHIPRGENPRSLTREQRQLLIRAWIDGYSLERIKRVFNVCKNTALKYKPMLPEKQVSGYRTWSKKTQQRWDEFWSDPRRADRDDLLRHWNEEWLRRGRADLRLSKEDDTQ